MDDIIIFDSIHSTHEYAKELVNAKARECAVIANRQLNGVGRCDRKWISENGNLYLSVIRNRSYICDDASDEYYAVNGIFSKFSLTVGCAVHELLSHNINSANLLTMHWPNDVYYDGLKVSGILIELIGNWMIISVGINIYSKPDLPTAISMREIYLRDSKSLLLLKSPIELMHEFLSVLETWRNLLVSCGFSTIKDYWLRNVNDLKCIITIKNGNDSITGIFVDIDDIGRLVLEHEGKQLFISSGDLFINQKGIEAGYE